jgi:hypothetical protein
MVWLIPKIICTDAIDNMAEGKNVITFGCIHAQTNDRLEGLTSEHRN